MYRVQKPSKRQFYLVVDINYSNFAEEINL